MGWLRGVGVTALLMAAVVGDCIRSDRCQGHGVGTTARCLAGGRPSRRPATKRRGKHGHHRGTFALFTVIHAHAVTIHGALARKSAGITMLSAGAGRRNQRFWIKDRLTRVGIRARRDGAGTVSAVLTHHRTRILAYCVTYSASVAGTIPLTFG